ncbi:Hypothetical protein SMAX5B_013872 [Scophthalmus maximus]|uniref:Uncharacterized protein n=1 Tax=Scophthalmus maximus TaxID=52904 RepID=A0A2U9CG32_SCOMX|nr:Hypothetical protein SMAX5B_013872 [Scophthalmus maximus]
MYCLVCAIDLFHYLCCSFRMPQIQSFTGAMGGQLRGSLESSNNDKKGNGKTSPREQGSTSQPCLVKTTHH